MMEFDYPYKPRMRDWDQSPAGNVCRRLIAEGTPRYREHLTALLACKAAFAAIPAEEPADERVPFWSNTWFPPLDGICLSGMLARLNPRRYVEVGSGNSTKFARRAVTDHGLRTEIVSIDPYPRAVIDDLCDRVIRQELELCDLDVFADLGPDDLLFVDNSHRSFQNSDVTVFFYRDPAADQTGLPLRNPRHLPAFRLSAGVAVALLQRAVSAHGLPCSAGPAATASSCRFITSSARRSCLRSSTRSSSIRLSAERCL